MQIAYELLQVLKDGKFHSGTALAHQLRVSRSCVWKGVDYLRKLSLLIHAVQGKGYRWYEPMELLDKDLITQCLDEDTRKAISTIDVVNLIPSTNDYLLQRVQHGIRQGAVCAAEGQSAGKGRMGRKWHSPFAANLYFSIYWRFDAPLQTLAGLSLVVGLAVIEALQQSAPLPEKVGIKWPNDIYWGNAKLGGVLAETHRDEGIVIGVGLNVSMPNTQIDGQAITDLSRLWGSTPSRNILISRCLNSMVKAFKQFERGGLNAFSSHWAQYDLLQNKEVELVTSESSVVGIAQGINERGELLIQFGETLKAIRSGDVRIYFDTNFAQKN